MCIRDRFLSGGLSAVDAVRPTGDVDDGLDESFVEGHGRVAIAGDPPLVAEGFPQCVTEDDRNVFDGVVLSLIHI